MALNEERSSFLAESNIRNFARNAKNQVIYCEKAKDLRIKGIFGVKC